MSRATTAELADRRSLLSARAELDRARVTLATHEVIAIVAPPPDPARAATLRPAIAMLVGLIASMIGTSRFARWLRITSWGLRAWRIARSWRSPAR